MGTRAGEGDIEPEKGKETAQTGQREPILTFPALVQTTTVSGVNSHRRLPTGLCAPTCPFLEPFLCSWASAEQMGFPVQTCPIVSPFSWCLGSFITQPGPTWSGSHLLLEAQVLSLLHLLLSAFHFSDHPKPLSTTGPLHSQFSLPGMPLSQLSTWMTPSRPGLHLQVTSSGSPLLTPPSNEGPQPLILQGSKL